MDKSIRLVWALDRCFGGRFLKFSLWLPIRLSGKTKSRNKGMSITICSINTSTTLVNKRMNIKWMTIIPKPTLMRSITILFLSWRNHKKNNLKFRKIWARSNSRPPRKFCLKRISCWSFRLKKMCWGLSAKCLCSSKNKRSLIWLKFYSFGLRATHLSGTNKGWMKFWQSFTLC